MRVVLLMILFSPLAFSQEEMIPFIEIAVNTRNTNGNTVYFSANSQTNRWTEQNNQYYLTTQYQTVNMTINGDTLSCEPRYGFGFGHHPGENTLAYSTYKFSVVNPGKSAWFEIDAIGCTFNGDIHITYDWIEDAFYIGGDCGTYGTEPINHQTIVMFYNPIRFQPTTPANLLYSWSGGQVNLIWYHSEPFSAARYEVWRKIMGGARYTQTIEDWTLICTNSAGDTTHLDREFNSGSGYKAYYKIRAVSGDGKLYSPGWSNEISITGNFLPLDRQPSGRKLTLDTTPQLNLFPNPFNTTLRINLYSPMKQITDISIYDLLGRAVKEFHPTPDGYYFDTIWNGADNQGQPLKSGIYFLIVRSRKEMLFRQKIVYLK